MSFLHSNENWNLMSLRFEDSKVGFKTPINISLGNESVCLLSFKIRKLHIHSIFFSFSKFFLFSPLFSFSILLDQFFNYSFSFFQGMHQVTHCTRLARFHEKLTARTFYHLMVDFTIKCISRLESVKYPCLIPDGRQARLQTDFRQVPFLTEKMTLA